MHIKYITNVRIPTPRAQGYAIMKMCSEFAKNFAEVQLFVPERESSELKGDPFQFYNINKNFEIRKVPSFDFLGKTLRFGKLFYWVDMLSFFIMSRFTIDLGKDDLLYTRDFFTALFFSKSSNMILELHDIPKSKFLFKLAIKKFRLFFVLNNNLKQELVIMGVEESIIFISPSGVEISEFNINMDKEVAREKMGLPQDKNIIMYTGHLYGWKGADTLAEAAISMPETLFIFVGGVEPEFSKFIKKYKNYSNIVARPFVERHIIPIYLQSADVLVLPNSGKEKISARYTSPLKLLEYMASNRPIVASKLSSILEVVSDRECIFAEADNPISFSSSIRKVLDDSVLAKDISKNALNKVEQFSWGNRVKNILSIINNHTQ